VSIVVLYLENCHYYTAQYPMEFGNYWLVGDSAMAYISGPYNHLI